jgi:voltage-gated potassium channel Kch
MALTPLLVPLATRLLRPRAAAAETRAGPEGGDAGAPDSQRVVLVGAGRMGQVVAQMLRARGLAVTAIDLDPELIDMTARFGNTVFWGDGTRLDILRSAGIDQARALVFAMDGAWNPQAVLGPIRQQWPDLPIIARAHDRSHLIALRQSGLDQVVRETFESGVMLGREALVALGTPDTMVEAIAAEYRRRDAERLALQLVSGDIMSGADSIIRGALDLDPSSLGEIPPA